MHLRYLRRLVLVTLLALLSLPAPAGADPYPVKPLTLVVPFPAGGVVDVIGRRLAEALGEGLGQRVIVENRAGAGGTIGAKSVANAAADGYTLLMGGLATHVFAGSLYSDLGYDAVKSFVPISQISSGPLVLVVKSNFAGKSLSEFIKFIKDQGTNSSYASNGAGTLPHVATEMLKDRAGLQARHVPFRGGQEATLGVLRGDVTFSLNHIPNVLGQVRAGELRALATSDVKRSSAFPDVPTFEEAGLKDFQASAWFGVFAPRGTPEAVVRKLEAETTKALRLKKVREQLLATGDEPVGSSSEEFAAYVKAELAKWAPIIKGAGLKPN